MLSVATGHLPLSSPDSPCRSGSGQCLNGIVSGLYVSLVFCPKYMNRRKMAIHVVKIMIILFSSRLAKVDKDSCGTFYALTSQGNLSLLANGSVQRTKLLENTLSCLVSDLLSLHEQIGVRVFTYNMDCSKLLLPATVCKLKLTEVGLFSPEWIGMRERGFPVTRSRWCPGCSSARASSHCCITKSEHTPRVQDGNEKRGHIHLYAFQNWASRIVQNLKVQSMSS